MAGFCLSYASSSSVFAAILVGCLAWSAVNFISFVKWDWLDRNEFEMDAEFKIEKQNGIEGRFSFGRLCSTCAIWVLFYACSICSFRILSFEVAAFVSLLFAP